MQTNYHSFSQSVSLTLSVHAHEVISILGTFLSGTCRDTVSSRVIQKVERSTNSVHAQLKPRGYTGSERPLRICYSTGQFTSTVFKGIVHHC